MKNASSSYLLLSFLFNPFFSGLIFAATIHVAPSGNDVNSGSSWAEAKQTIQAGVDAASTGDLVLVTNGVYDVGGRAVAGQSLTNRVIIDRAITVMSVNGPADTVIQGARDPVTIYGDAAIRCVWMTNGALLAGFTLSGGATRGPYDYTDNPDFSGGGVYAVSDLPVLSNCVVSGNAASGFGGGAFKGTLLGCTLVSNQSPGTGGGAFDSVIEDCDVLNNSAPVGGGVSSCTVRRSLLAGNEALVQHGGGALNSDLENCLLTGNRTSGGVGAGAYGGILKNCTVVGNQFIGVADATVTNCIIYFNTGFNTGVDDNIQNLANIEYSCTFPMPTNGMGNITNNPAFVDLDATNLQLLATSPCRDAGIASAAPAVTDLAGNSRTVHGYSDMGAYEFQGGDGQADFDGDGTGNGDEQVAGSDLADPASFFQLFTSSMSVPTTLSFDSVSGRVYAVEYADDLNVNPQEWTSFTNNIPGTGLRIDILSPEDGAVQRYYRAQVGLPASP